MQQFDQAPVEADAIESSLATIVQGSTAPSAFSVGKYIYLKHNGTLDPGLYRVKSAIAQGDTLSSSNLEQESEGVVNALNGKIDTELQFPAKDQDRGRALLAMTDSGNNYMVFRLIQSADESDYFQIIFWGAQKKITIVKAVNGVETTVATFSGT